MSTVSRLLHRSISTSASIRTLSEDLYKERNLKRLVEKFKICSSSVCFRAKSGIYETTVRRLASAKRYIWIKEILEHQTQYKYELSKENFTVRLIKLYGQSGMFEDAKNMFDEMPNRNCERTVNSLNALLSAAVDSKKFDKMEDLFKELETKWNVKPDIVTYNTMIKGFCKMGKFSNALDLVDEMGRDGLNPDLITYNTLFDQLYKNSRFVDAETKWKQMIEDELSPNIRSYNSKLIGLVSEKMFKEADELISEMEKSGVNPDVFSYGALVKGHCSVGNVDEVKKWYSKLVKNKFVADRALFGTVLLCACENGDYDWCFELCKELFDRKLLVDSGVLQKVVDLFVKDSRIEEAKKIVDMGKSNDYHLYQLQLAEEK